MEYHKQIKERINIKTKEINKMNENMNDKNLDISGKNKKIIKTYKSIFFYTQDNYINDKYLLYIQNNFKIYFSIFTLLLIPSINFFKFFIESNRKSYLFKSYEISLKIKGNGNFKILSDSFFDKYKPSEIYINNGTQNDINNFYTFDNQENYNNTVIIIWDVEKINTADSMFSNCNQIIEINFSRFNTSEIIFMASMFYNCSSLISLDLSNFDISRVSVMTNMFKDCSSLISLNLDNCKASIATYFDKMFYGCSSLISLSLENFSLSNAYNLNSMFKNCKSLISLDLSSFYINSASDMGEMFSGCSSLIYLDLSNFHTSNSPNMSYMFFKCENLKYINLKRAYKQNGLLINNIFSSTSDYLIVCIDNDNDYLINLLDGKIIIYCNNINLYHENINKCYLKNSTINNKYICDICGKNFKINYISNDQNNETYIDCFELKYGYYFDEVDRQYKLCYNSCKTCEIEGNKDINNCLECKEEFTFEINISNSNYKNCIKNNISIYKVVENLINNFNFIDLNDGNDKKIISENKEIILTSTTNQKKKEDKNNITMDLGQCENILKNHYNISYNNSLYILQIITEEKGMKIPKMEYEIYYPLYNDNELIKLNLSYCQDTKIDISISVKIDGQLDKYNSSSDYYNNICYKTTSEIGTDISLNDRRNEFVNNNLSLCEENCELTDYDYIKEKAKCSCDIKTNISSYDDIKFNKNDFFKSFIDINNIMNIKILKCYKRVLKIKELQKNYGFFIVSFSVFCYFITLFIFIIKSNSNYKKEIKNIIWALKFNEFPFNKNHITTNPYPKVNRKKTFFVKKKDKNKIRNNSRHTLLINKDKIYKKFRDIKKKKFDTHNLILTKKILKRKEFEFNSLNYEEVLKIDHRNYCQYYYYLLKYYHPLSFSFASYNDYNIQIIKKFLFFFSFSIDFTINALFLLMKLFIKYIKIRVNIIFYIKFLKYYILLL